MERAFLADITDWTPEKIEEERNKLRKQLDESNARHEAVQVELEETQAELEAITQKVILKMKEAGDSWKKLKLAERMVSTGS